MEEQDGLAEIMHDACIETRSHALRLEVRHRPIRDSEREIPRPSSLFVEEKLGKQFVENRAVPFNKSYEEMNTSTPVFFILSPGVDPIKDVEALGKKLGFTTNQKTFHNISLGQGTFIHRVTGEKQAALFSSGQQIVAEEAMDIASKEGHWVVLQNIHLGESLTPQQIRHGNVRSF